MRIFCERGDFDLPANFMLEISKTNPFISDEGEQSYPITIRASDINKRLTNYSSRLDKLTQPLEEMTVVVQEGVLCRKANMVFNDFSNEEIVATIYFSEGNFYSLIDGKNLIDDIEWPTETQIDTAAWYARCHRVYDGVDNADWKLMETMLNKTIHLALVSDDTLTVQYDLGELPMVTNLKNYFLHVMPIVGSNDTVSLQPETNEFLAEAGNSYVRYYYKEGENWCRFPALYMITPMLKTRWVINHIFTSFGFEWLNANHTDFDDDVISNSVVDALCRQVLYYKQLVPDKSIADFIKDIERSKCARFVFSGRNVTYEPFSFSTNKPTTKTIDQYRSTDSPTISVEKEAYAINIAVSTGEDYVVAEELLDGTIQGEDATKGGFPGQYFPIKNYEDYVTFKKWTQNNPLPEAKTTTTDTINGAGTDLLLWTIKVVYWGINYQGKMLSQIAKIQEPVWLNTQVVDTTSGEPSITEADVRQSSTWCLLKSRNQMYHGFFLYQGIDGYKEKYIDLVQANVAQSVFVDYAETWQNPTYKYISEILYAKYVAFRNKANIIVETKTHMPLHVLANLDITAPSILENQEVMIESITYTLPIGGEEQQVRLRTLRERDKDTSIE